MLQYSGHFVYFPGPECDPMDQAYACLYLASKMGCHVKGQVLQVCNGRIPVKDYDAQDFVLADGGSPDF